MTFKNSRRSSEPSQTEACRGNSRCRSSLKSSVSASSSRQRQYSTPRTVESRRRMKFKSIDRSLIGALLLSMTCRTTRQLLNFVFPDQFSAERELIRGRQIIHAEHVPSRAAEAFRYGVTPEAPVHVRRVFTPHERHLSDSSMTSGR